MEIIVDNRLAFTDDAHAARAIFSHAQKEIAFDQIVVALSQGERARAVAKCVVSENIIARLVGNDLNLPIGSLEQIVFH